MLYKIFVLIFITIVGSRAFGGGDDRYIRKYAMMKVYESCLGPEVVKEVRKEMKAACAKCSGVSITSPGQDVPPPPPPPPVAEEGPEKDQQPPRKHTKPMPPTPLSQFDAYKLQQAILGFRSQNPYAQAQSAQAHAQAQAQAQAAQLQAQAAQSAPFRFQQAGGYYGGQFAQPFSPVQNALYYPLGNSLYTPQQSFYPSPYYQFPVGQSQAYLGHRSSRDLDVRGQLETLTAHMAGGGKIRNVTCVMQELGYLDENLEPNYEKITERIGRLPVANELKRDMADGVEFCRQFAQCVPEIKRDKFPLSRELAKPMFFFRCYKHKKLEACIMKDVRERYAQSEDLNDDDPMMTSGELRSLNWSKDKGDYEDMAVAMYEFLYGGDNMEFETLM